VRGGELRGGARHRGIARPAVECDEDRAAGERSQAASMNQGPTSHGR
jgi:hypothetical protein